MSLWLGGQRQQKMDSLFSINVVACVSIYSCVCMQMTAYPLPERDMLGLQCCRQQRTAEIKFGGKLSRLSGILIRVLIISLSTRFFTQSWSTMVESVNKEENWKRNGIECKCELVKDHVCISSRTRQGQGIFFSH